MNSDNLITIFCNGDDFCIKFEPDWFSTLLAAQVVDRNRKGNLKLSEIMTILIFFHLSCFKKFKHY